MLNMAPESVNQQQLLHGTIVLINGIRRTRDLQGSKISCMVGNFKETFQPQVVHFPGSEELIQPSMSHSLLLSICGANKVG